MRVRNKRSNKIFDTNRDFFENVIVAKGNGDMYDVIEDDAPLEVRKMRDVIEMKKKQSNPAEKTG